MSNKVSNKVSNESKNFIVTIDGPSASGKSSVSRLLAHNLGWSWLSTGAFYRGLAYMAQHEQIDLSDESSLVKLISSDLWSVEMGKEQTHVFYLGQDITNEVFLEGVGNAASQISGFPLLRKELIEVQRRYANKGSGLVAEGRDCGTVIFPQAQVKFYITASSKNRATRRALEESRIPGDIREVQERRDRQDIHRTVAPLAVPTGAEVIDTSQMSLDEVVGVVVEKTRKKLNLVAD